MLEPHLKEPCSYTCYLCHLGFLRSLMISEGVLWMKELLNLTSLQVKLGHYDILSL